MSEIKFQAKDKLLEDILIETSNKYRIPRYQRPYSWGQDQISDFWNDLVNEDDSYFVGSFIFNYQSVDDTGYIDIIDGQQRLLTITILSSALRDITDTFDKETADLIHNNEIFKSDRKGKGYFKIKPGESLYEFFTKYIQERGNSIFDVKLLRTQKEFILVKKNYEYFHKKILNELNGLTTIQQKINRVNEIRDRIAELIVIHIRIENENQAYEIFETTNARGVDLSIADLLKNAIFKELPPEEDKDFAKSVWLEISSYIENTGTDMKKFIRYFWLSKYSFVTEKKLFKEIKRRTKKTEYFKLLIDLWESAECYNKMLIGNEDEFSDLKNGEKIHRALFAIKLMDVTQCYVLILCLFNNYGKLGTDPTKIFNLIEKFTFIYSAISKLPGNQPERLYSKYAIEIEEAIKNSSEKTISGNIQRIFTEIEKSLKEISPKLESFQEKFLDLTYTINKKRRLLLSYIMEGINNYFSPTMEQKIDFVNVNIEHILPKKPSKDWKLSDKEISSYVDLLGNLTLLDKKINSRIQNSVMQTKIKEYESSQLPITKELVRLLTELKFEWNEEEIIKRQLEFSKIAFNHIWKY